MSDLPTGLEGVLRQIGEEIATADPLQANLLKREAVQRLEAKGIKAPTQLVEDAVKSASRSRNSRIPRKGITFEDPDPWSDPVDGTKLLADLAKLFGRYLVLPKGAATVLALWSVYTHCYEAFSVSPILALTSPEKRCGKTTVLRLLTRLVRRGLPASNISAAAVFRTVEACAPTLLIDEADTFLNQNDDMRGVLNSGHTRDTAFTVRTVGENYEPMKFNTFCPKVIAQIRKPPDTIEDRSIVIRMRRKAPEEGVQRLRVSQIRHELSELHSRMARFGLDNLESLRHADPEVPEGLNDRAADNWRPFIAIAEAAGGIWPEQARKAARLLSGEHETESSVGVELLADIKAIFESGQADRLFTETILDKLHEMDDRPWPEFGKAHKPITAPTLARLLKRFDIKPKQIRIGTATKKGYEGDQFEDAFHRYIPSEAKHPKQPNSDGDFRDFQSETNGVNVSDGNSQEPNNDRQCFVVSDGSGGSGKDSLLNGDEV